MDDIAAKFLPRFASLARERLRNALEVAGTRRHASAAGVTRDMHALAGEAGLLGLDTVLTGARRAEAAARQYGASGSDGDAQALVDSLRELERAVATTTATTPTTGL